MHALMTFVEALADAGGKLQAATDRDSLRCQFDHGSGVLRGYYFAGVVSEVEATAALERLRGIYRARFAQLTPDTRPRDVLDDLQPINPGGPLDRHYMERMP